MDRWMVGDGLSEMDGRVRGHGGMGCWSGVAGVRRWRVGVLECGIGGRGVHILHF